MTSLLSMSTKKAGLLAAALVVCFSAAAHAQIDPSSTAQVDWSKISNPGAPTAPCPSSTVKEGQPYFDSTNNKNYTCGASGWVLSSGTGGGSWNSNTNPSGNLSLTMGAYTSVFTFNAATGASDLWKLTDTASNTGTGIMWHATTASGSAETPWQADANGNGWKVGTDGSLQGVGGGPAYGNDIPEGTALTGAAGHDVYYADATSHTVKLSTNGGSFSSICTAANGLCSSGALPTWQGYTFVADSNAASVTSPAMSVTAGELLVVSCRFGTGTFGTATDSASNTYTALTAQVQSGTGVQISWAIASTTASITTSCAQASSAAGLSLVASHYANTGSTANTSAGASGSLTTAQITTSQRTLLVWCGVGGSLTSWPVSSVGSNWYSAGVSQSTLSATNAEHGCAWAVASGRFFGAIASPLTPASTAGVQSSSVLAVNY